MRIDGFAPISDDEWPELRSKLQADLTALLRPEFNAAGIERLYVLGSGEAGLSDPPWDGAFSTDAADVFRGKLGDRWEGPGAAFLLKDELREFGSANIVATAVHEAAHVADSLCQGINVAVSRALPVRLARPNDFGPESPPVPQPIFLLQHRPEWCRLTVHLAERMRRLGWPIAHWMVIGYPELGTLDQYRAAMLGELWRLNSATLSEIVATGPHAGVNALWVENVVAAMNVPDAAAKPKRVRRKPVLERVGR